MLPLSYAIRNLFRTPARFAQLVFGSALVVFLLVGAAAINEGMAGVLAATGDPRNVILLGAGSEESVERSEVPPGAAAQAAAAVRGLEERLGRVAVSPEVHYQGALSLPGGGEGQALFRGVTPDALLVHPQVRLVEGRFPGPGEVMVGRSAHHKLRLPAAGLATGSTVTVGGQRFAVSGLFAAPATLLESEVWAGLGDLLAVTQRENLSCVVLRLGSAEFEDVDLFAKQRLDLEVAAVAETDYYGGLAGFYAPLRLMTWVTAALVAAGAVFGGINTLYAAFSSRVRELATLQAVGFRRRALALSLVQESLFATLAGTLVALAAALAFLDGVAVPFSVGTFSLAPSPGALLGGLGGGAALGLFGALPPACACLRPPVPVALRSA